MHTTFSDFATITSGISLGKINSYNHDSAPKEGAIQLIRPQDMATNPILFETDFKTLEVLALTDSLLKRIKETHYLKTNDIAITSRGTRYHASIIKSLPKNSKIIMNNNLICLRPHKTITHPEAILVYLNSQWFREKVIQKEFSSRLSLSVGWVKTLPFTLPDNEACKNIAQALITHQQLQADLKSLSEKSNLLLEAQIFSYQPKQ